MRKKRNKIEKGKEWRRQGKIHVEGKDEDRRDQKDM